MLKSDDQETTKLFIAALESFQTGKITPLLKEELKYSIQTRRLAEGKEELSIEFDTNGKPEQELTQDEVERKERRKEQNRRAAAKFRNKRKQQLTEIQCVCNKLQLRNRELKREVNCLQKERDALHEELSDIMILKRSTPPDI